MAQGNQNRKSSNIFWNILTLFALMSSVLILIVQLTIFVNPFAIFNPFPPVEIPELVVLPTSTVFETEPTEVVLESQPTALIPTQKPAEIPTSIPTEVIEIQDGTLAIETPVLPPTETPFVGYYAFVIQNEPNAINSTIFKVDLECNWTGIAGQVFDLQGRPVKGIRVWLRGRFDNKDIDYLGLTLESSPYGPSGFEFTLGESPKNTKESLYLQLLDQAGIPISDRVYIDTFEDCERNLILVNFKQVR
ncbi:MAG: hypothetical protein CVU46_16945 [Chloroflexi bacterium HGW-Chloroflexi-8]|nr:MAG: hypothetical protein CVU46_16945 [Chloroflexi bacterium HGW-Chloroflexi-8]